MRCCCRGALPTLGLYPWGLLLCVLYGGTGALLGRGGSGGMVFWGWGAGKEEAHGLSEPAQRTARRWPPMRFPQLRMAAVRGVWCVQASSEQGETLGR